MNEHQAKKFPTIACCGLDCGLCPRYYTIGPSRCPGCCGPDFFNKHPSCSYITCCVKKKKLEVCALCDEFPCSKFVSSQVDGEEYDSFLTYKKVYQNMEFIRQHGLEKFLKQQSNRIQILEDLLKNFDDGKSKSYFCLATTLLSIKEVQKAVYETRKKIKKGQIDSKDPKLKSKTLRGFLEESATREGIELRLRKKRK